MVTKDKLINAFYDAGIVESKTLLPEGAGYNCRHHLRESHREGCACTTNDVLRAVDEAFKE